ncbi:MAG: aminopeptidase [Lutibacter sp.]
MKRAHFIFLYCCSIATIQLWAQTNNIKIDAQLFPKKNEINIKQTIEFYNSSKSILSEIYFFNWPNAYKNKNTPLANRIVENYKRSFHFTADKNRGFSFIKSIQINKQEANWVVKPEHPDIVKVILEKQLKPNEKVEISFNYKVKLPNAKFTNYGFLNDNFYLRYWYIIPAIKNNTWQIFSNLNLDDIYVDYTNYQINFKIPKTYTLFSELHAKKNEEGNFKYYQLNGLKRNDIEIAITKNKTEFEIFNTNPIQIISSLSSAKINKNIQTSIFNRSLGFLKYYLGAYPHQQLMITRNDYEKNPVYGFNQLPHFLAPFNDVFEWDIKQFKILAENYIKKSFLFNERKDAWFVNGLQTYLMIKYVEKYYPNQKAIGSVAKLWGLKNFNLAKIGFNEKYQIVYQFAARKNLDQPLTMQSDSLSNFNEKITNRYKAALGLYYLNTYLGNNEVEKSILSFSKKYHFKKTNSQDFLYLLKTDKNINWFTKDFLNTNKKIDYKIKKIKHVDDSLKVTIKNKRKFTAPIQLYGLKNNTITFKKWLTGIDSVKTITIPKNGFNRLSLNYEGLLTECNLKNNWKNVNRSILNRPLQVKFLKDIEDPYYNELFYTPVFRFNYYDGAILGLALSNKTILKKQFTYKVIPSFSTKSKTFSGNYSFLYEYLPENSRINKLSFGFFGANYQYDKNLTYSSFNPYFILQFKRKDLRSVANKALMASYTIIDKEFDPNQTAPRETNNYQVFNLSFGYAKPAILEDVRWATDFQLSSKFSKLSLTARYRKLTNTNRQFDFRFYTGIFLKNKTTSNYFDFALDRPTDYLFQYNYLGRSETTGFFSQQVIINEGGFKSKLPVAYANQWISTLNFSIGLWRWIEAYNDVGFVKNRNQKVFFAHENGFRLNFIQDILEIYFPFHSNLGWEISQPQYATKIRFVLEIQPKKIFNFIRRGFF